MENERKTVVGIDPDVEKSGVCVLKACTIQSISSLRFPALVDFLTGLSQTTPSAIVCVEGGWLNKSLWHRAFQQNPRVCGHVGKSVGANQQVGKLIVQIALHKGLQVKVVRPLTKRWKGKDGKITQSELSCIAKQTGFGELPKGRTNQDERDAILLAIVSYNSHN